VRAKAIALAITGALAVSGIAAAAPAQAGRHRCDTIGGSHPRYTGPYAYAPYYYGYPADCGGFSFYLAPTFYGYGYPSYFIQESPWHLRRSN
jgi:hypothetical protein